MNDEKYDNFNHLINRAEKEMINLVKNSNQLNKKFMNCINNFQIIEREIYNALFDAKQYYNLKCRYCNKKIKKLRRKAIEFKELMDYHIFEKRNYQNPKLKSEFSRLTNSIKDSIREITNKIDNLNQKIKNQILDIREENNLVEKINRLEKKKKKRIELLSKTKRDFNNNDYIQILRKISLLEISIKEIYRHLNKWSVKRTNYHKKMLDLYRDAKTFRNFKNKLENSLRENKDIANQYHQQFLNVMNQNEKNIIKELWHKSNPNPPQRKIITPIREAFILKQRLYRKFMQGKLAVALEKQKAGKKLHISEYKLILKHTKK